MSYTSHENEIWDSSCCPLDPRMVAGLTSEGFIILGAGRPH